MTPDRERIEREAAIILRNLRHGLTEERTAKSITALVRRAVEQEKARADAFESLAWDLRDLSEDGVRPDVIVEKFLRDLAAIRARGEQPQESSCKHTTWTKRGEWRPEKAAYPYSCQDCGERAWISEPAIAAGYVRAEALRQMNKRGEQHGTGEGGGGRG